MRRNKKRIGPFCEEFMQIWRRNPDLRFGQLIEMISYRVKQEKKTLFYIEDEALMDLLKQMFNSD